MGIIVFNFRGIGMCAIAFAAAFAAGKVFGFSGEGPLMVVAGPILAGLDLTYRARAKDRRWFSSDRGGSLFFLPVWCFGILWLILGISYALQPPTKSPASPSLGRASTHLVQ